VCNDCYNPTTGVFTAPKTGLYQVSATVMSSNLKMLHVHLWQNEKPLVALYAAVGYNESTANTVLNLKKNDRLYVALNTIKQTNNCLICSFFI
jgi:phosphoribosylamine-glycine ligase